MLAADSLLVDGKKIPGPSAPTAIMVDTPAFSGAKLGARVQAQGAVLGDVKEPWELAGRARVDGVR